MALNIVSVVEIVFVIIAVPAGGAILFHAMKKASERLEIPVKVSSSALLLYFLINWVVLEPSTTETFLLGLPLGRSPVALILYTAFAAGTSLGAFSSEINEFMR